MTPLLRQPFGLRYIVDNPNFMSNNNEVENIIAFTFVAFQKPFRGLRSRQLMLYRLLWDRFRR